MAAARTRSSGYPETKAPARNDAYTGLLIISLLAQVVGALFLFLDWNQYPDTKPKAVPTITVPAAPGGGGAGQQGGAAQKGGGAQMGNPK
jgi:hypothetical protein